MDSGKILITGGAGFIGARLALRLLREGCSVRILDSLSPQIHGDVPLDLHWLSTSGVEFFRGSVTSRADWQRVLEGVEQVVHFAAETGTGQSMYEVERYCSTNLTGTALLIEAVGGMATRTVRRIVLASSRAIYGEGAYVCTSCNNGERINPMARTAEQLLAHRWQPRCSHCGGELTAVPTAENDPVRPASIYAATKYGQEDLVRIGAQSMGIDYVLYRFQNVYGEGQSLKNPYTGILSIFSTRIRRDLELPIFEDGLETRDFVHVDDVVEAVKLGIEASEPVNDVFNVGSGVATSVYSLAEALTAAFSRTPRVVVTSQFRVGDIRHNCADMRRIKERLAFIPRISLHEGLRRFAAWVETQPLPEDRLEQANSELRARKLMG